ncbi:MAG: hydroxylamine reductase [Thermoguttaceae bacterium]
MYCFQCEQTAKGTGCTVMGVCGKDPTTAALQDLLVNATKGISMFAHRAAELGSRDPAIDRAILEFLFATVTNVDFDPERLERHLRDAARMRDAAKSLYETACQKAGRVPETLGGPAAWQPAGDLGGLVRQGDNLLFTKRQTRLGADLAGLQELILYGLKGAAAYADHARILGYEDPKVYAAFHAALDFLAQETPAPEAMLGWVMKAGELNLTVMGLLDAANTGVYGNPEPTTVRVTPRKGKCIAVSGHDLKDLDALLKQTAGKDINVYTHGEMLPCHAYPGLKKYKHLVGNYGGAWQDQRSEFEQFPGSILMTTNCIQKPKESYLHRIFTTGLVAWPSVRHIGQDHDFTPVIEAALAESGFPEDAPEQTITVGFGHHAVLAVAEKVVAAVKAKKIRHFFLVGGCDGAKSGRNYYTMFAQAVPKDCVILTLACGKYRFNKLPFGSIDGIPRLLDVGQCNDAYSAIKIATALANAFQCEVNQLPLSFVLSWYEQKAVAILLSLLYLGVKNIRLGPSLPAFITQPVLKLLVEKFDIGPITTPEADLATFLG